MKKPLARLPVSRLPQKELFAGIPGASRSRIREAILIFAIS